MRALRRLIFTNILFLSFATQAKSTLYCSKESLKLKNCLLSFEQGHYQFLKQNLSIDDGKWKGVVAVPRTEEPSEWKSLKLFKKAGRLFYELKIWTPPQKDVSLQSLHWIIVEIDGTQVITRLDQVIQKRRRIAESDQKFILDKIEKHTLSANKSKVVWQMGHLKGEF